MRPIGDEEAAVLVLGVDHARHGLHEGSEQLDRVVAFGLGNLAVMDVDEHAGKALGGAVFGHFD